MRYQVGEKIYGIHFRFEGMDAIQTSMFGMPYCYGDFRYIDQIEIVQLEVLEHHKVHNEYNDKGEPGCDGYILRRLTDNQIFYNQYPRASYGQVSDTGDRRFFIHIEGEEAQNKHLRRLKEGEYLVDEYHLLGDYLRNLTEGIAKYKEELAKGIPSIRELGEKEWLEARRAFSDTQLLYVVLRDLKDRIQHQFETQFTGLTFEMPLKPIFKNKDTGEWVTDFQVPTFTVVEKK